MTVLTGWTTEGAEVAFDRAPTFNKNPGVLVGNVLRASGPAGCTEVTSWLEPD